MLTAARGGVWCLEQPGNSVMEYYPCWLHFVSRHLGFFSKQAAPAPAILIKPQCHEKVPSVSFNLIPSKARKKKRD